MFISLHYSTQPRVPEVLNDPCCSPSCEGRNLTGSCIGERWLRSHIHDGPRLDGPEGKIYTWEMSLWTQRIRIAGVAGGVYGVCLLWLDSSLSPCVCACVGARCGQDYYCHTLIHTPLPLTQSIISTHAPPHDVAGGWLATHNPHARIDGLEHRRHA